MTVGSTQMHSELDVQVASLSTRVHGIEQGQLGIIATLDRLGNKIDAKSSTNWGVIGTFSSVVVAAIGLVSVFFWNIGGMAMSQVKADQERLAATLIKLDDKFMPATQITNAIGSATALTNAAQANSDKGLETNRAAIEHMRETSASKVDVDAAIKDVQERVRRSWDYEMALEKSVVPRGEHEEHWKADDQRFADVQRQLDDVKRVQNGLYDARDVIHDLNERTHQLEARPEARR